MIDQLEGGVEFDPRDVAYTGPNTLAGRYLRSFWQPIGASSSVKAGRARAVEVLGEQFTLFRNESGQPHLLDHRCAHRGTQLSVGTVEGDSIRCLYHGWRFDATGQCVEQPGEPQAFCEKIRVRSFPVRDYLGIVFAYLGESEPPEFPRYERFEEHERSLRLMIEVAPFNYFQRMENSHDFAHLPFVHKQCYPPGPRTLETVVPRVLTEECSWGMRTHRVDPNGLDLVAYFGMPNINYIVIGAGTGKEWEGEGELLLMRVPVDDSNHLQFLLSWTNSTTSEVPAVGEVTNLHNAERNEIARAVLDGNMTMDDVIARGGRDLFSIQDDVAMIGQGTIWQRNPEHLGRTDAGVILLRKLWARDMRALRDGEPRQQWVRTPDMRPYVAAAPRGLG